MAGQADGLAWDDSDERGVVVGQVGWPRRRADLERERELVAVYMDAIAVTHGPGRQDLSGLSGAELAEIGVWAAARWTLGEAATAPMTKKPAALTWEQVREELTWAEVFSRGNLADWEYSTGVYCWMRWIVGDAKVMTHPGW